ncbi:response regulator transcription factor [Oceanibacterium hippocampi]|uniref:response regulator transcription factor n=1 Tax=Oceanibacterium hippocampi TaxID=745714 RepID=UPI001C39030E|nr:response regulator transcription factor [Oceanibacterium hippocampi]
MASGRVVIVDDDEAFREILGFNLSDEGYHVTEFRNGQEFLDYLGEGGDADIVLLDWKMPEKNGLEVLREMRGAGNDLPVVFLTVMSDEMYEEAALAGGAVDFVDKSRSLTIITRRMRLILEGIKGAASADVNENSGDVVIRGELELRPDIGRAFWKGERVELTLTEFDIVKLMATRNGEDLTYRQIYDLVHGANFAVGYGAEGYRANVRSFIKRIRQKFRDIDPQFNKIENYPGFGYRWVEGN